MQCSLASKINCLPLESADPERIRNGVQARSDHCVPMGVKNFYYEVTILDRGEKEYVVLNRSRFHIVTGCLFLAASSALDYATTYPRRRKWLGGSLGLGASMEITANTLKRLGGGCHTDPPTV